MAGAPDLDPPANQDQQLMAPATPPMKPPGIADRFTDLLAPLTQDQRQGMIAKLSVGYFEGWRPSRGEIADLVAVELGILTVDDCIQRQRTRKLGKPVVEVIAQVAARSRQHPMG